MNYEVNTGYKWWSPTVKTRDIYIVVSSLFSSFSSIFFYFEATNYFWSTQCIN